MIEYKNDEALNFETIEQESLTKENIIAELTRRIESREQELMSTSICKSDLFIRGELCAYKLMCHQIINNCFLK